MRRRTMVFFCIICCMFLYGCVDSQSNNNELISNTRNLENENAQIKRELSKLIESIEEITVTIESYEIFLNEHADLINSQNNQLNALQHEIDILSWNIEQYGQIIKNLDDYNESYGYYSNKNDQLTIDFVEFITTDDSNKLEELSLTEEDLPNGFIILNPNESYSEIELGKKVIFKVYYNSIFSYVSYDDFLGHMREGTLVKIIMFQDKIIEVQEFYLP